MIKDIIETIIDEAAEYGEDIFPGSRLTCALKKRILDAIATETITLELYDMLMRKINALTEELAAKTGLIDDMENFMGRIGHLRDWLEFQPPIMEGS